MNDESVRHVDLRNVLDGQDLRQFFDYVHTTARANRLIAQHIFSSLLADEVFLARIESVANRP